MGSEYLILKVPTLEFERASSISQGNFVLLYHLFFFFFIAVKFKAFRGTFVVCTCRVPPSKDSLCFWFGVNRACVQTLPVRSTPSLTCTKQLHTHTHTPEMVLSLTVAGPAVALIWLRASAIQSCSANKSKKERS